MYHPQGHIFWFVDTVSLIVRGIVLTKQKSYDYEKYIKGRTDSRKKYIGGVGHDVTI